MRTGQYKGNRFSAKTGEKTPLFPYSPARSGPPIQARIGATDRLLAAAAVLFSTAFVLYEDEISLRNSRFI